MSSVDGTIDHIRQEFESNDYDMVLYDINGYVDDEVVHQSRTNKIL